MTTTLPGLELTNYELSDSDLCSEVVEGMTRSPKALPCKFLYDQRGSSLFEQICDLEEYYQTRTEVRIMRQYMDQISSKLGAGCCLIEFGSGSSLKTRILLNHLAAPVAYVPIDICRYQIEATARRLAISYPRLEVLPVCADYARSFEVPQPKQKPLRRVIYFPGSTIGNLHPDDARRFLRRLSDMAGTNGALLIGVDICQSPEILLPAYNDSRGITAEFNLNLLRRINREAGGTFRLNCFAHRAVWNEKHKRIEMCLQSQQRQQVEVNGFRFEFSKGETIRTECSYKYTPEFFATLAEGFDVDCVWTDTDRRFSIQYLTVIS